MQNDFVTASTQLAAALESGQVLQADAIQQELDSFAFQCALAKPEELQAVADQIATIQHHAGQHPALKVPPLPTLGPGQMG